MINTFLGLTIVAGTWSIDITPQTIQHPPKKVVKTPKTIKTIKTTTVDQILKENEKLQKRLLEKADKSLSRDEPISRQEEAKKVLKQIGLFNKFETCAPGSQCALQSRSQKQPEQTLTQTPIQYQYRVQPPTVHVMPNAHVHPPQVYLHSNSNCSGSSYSNSNCSGSYNIRYQPARTRRAGWRVRR